MDLLKVTIKNSIIEQLNGSCLTARLIIFLFFVVFLSQRLIL